MIQSLFVLNGSGEVIIEKHWRGNASRDDSLTFWSALLAASRVAADVPPFIQTAKGILTHLSRSGLFFLASAHAHTLPLVVSDFLTTLADTLFDYFGELNEHAIKDNFITVYELLDEMLDNGFPLTLEPNVLKQLVAPPTMFTKVIGSVTGDTMSGASKGPTPNVSHTTPWRREGVRYAQNEVFVDVMETVDVIYSASGNPKLSHALVRGTVNMNCRLSGVPDIMMTMRSVAPVNDTALHHCVRKATFKESGQLSFVPPDGPFTLMDYVIRSQHTMNLPVDVEPVMRFDHDAGTGTVSVTIRPRFTIPPSPYANRTSAPSLSSTMGGAKQSLSSVSSSGMMLANMIGASTRIGVTGTGGTTQSTPQENIMQDVELVIPFGNAVSTAALSANIGTVEFESATGVCTWTVGGLARGVVPTLTGTVTLAGGIASSGLVSPNVLAKFRIPGLAISGMYVDKLELGQSEGYKYFKGLRCVTCAGRYEIRP